MAIELTQVIPTRETISLNSKTLPAIKNWKVGKNYEIHIKVREVGVHEDNFDDKKQLHATFEVIRAMECDDE
jgi:hypothetical protein